MVKPLPSTRTTIQHPGSSLSSNSYCFTYSYLELAILPRRPRYGRPVCRPAPAVARSGRTRAATRPTWVLPFSVAHPLPAANVPNMLLLLLLPLLLLVRLHRTPPTARAATEPCCPKPQGSSPGSTCYPRGCTPQTSPLLPIAGPFAPTFPPPPPPKAPPPYSLPAHATRGICKGPGCKADRHLWTCNATPRHAAMNTLALLVLQLFAWLISQREHTIH